VHGSFTPLTRNRHDPQVAGLSDPDPDRALFNREVLWQYSTPDDVYLMVQAAARDPSCVTALLHTALDPRHRLSSTAGLERRKEQHDKVLSGLLIAHNPLSFGGAFALGDAVGAAIAAAPPAALDTLGEWITQPGPSAAEVEVDTVRVTLRIAACAAIYSPAAAAALARRRSVVRALVSAVAIMACAVNGYTVDVLDSAFAMFAAMLRASSADLMRALAAGQPGSGRDGDDLAQRLRGLVEAAMARFDLQATGQDGAEALLAALAEGEEWLKTRVDQQQQQQQQRGSRACARCGKTAADEGVVKLRRCTGCPRESALRFCSVACQKAVWVGGHRQECPRLDTAAQHGEQQ